jgi:hypothetical protein
MFVRISLARATAYLHRGVRDAVRGREVEEQRLQRFVGQKVRRREMVCEHRGQGVLAAARDEIVMEKFVWYHVKKGLAKCIGAIEIAGLGYSRV